MLKDLVSVIIPVYNVEKYLKDSLESIIIQTYHKLEIILIDDGSTDGSGRICDEYASKDDRIIVVHQKNGGVSKARNLGLSLAQGEYITFVDGDDTIDPSYISLMYQEIKKDNIDIVRLSWERGGVNYTYNDVRYNSDGKCVIREDSFNNLKLCANIWGLFENNPNIRFNEELKNGEDSLFVIEQFVKSKHKRMLLVNKPYYHYTIVPKSASTLSASKRVIAHQIFLKQVAQLRNIYPKIDDLIKKHAFADYCSLMYYMMDNNIASDGPFTFEEVRNIVVSLRNGGAKYSDYLSEMKYFLYRYRLVALFKLLKVFRRR